MLSNCGAREDPGESLEKTLEKTLDSKEIKPGYHKVN